MAGGAGALSFDVTSDVSNFSRAMALVESTAKQKAASFALEFTGAGKRVETAIGDSAKRAATQAGTTLATAAKKYEAEFSAAAQTIGTNLTRALGQATAPAALGALRTAAVFAIGAFAGFEAVRLTIDGLTSAVAAASAELDRMAKIGADASRLGVSSTFLQTYSAQARALKVDADALVKSLETARAAFAVRQGEGGENARNDSAFGARLRDQMAAGNVTAAQVGRFDAASGTEAQFKAALDIMAELQAKGRDLAALDLAAKIFPPELVDRIRSGALELAQFRRMIDDVKNPDLVLLKPEEITRAQELQRRLEDAQATMDRAATEFRHELAQAGIGLREDAISWKELMASGARVAVSILQQARQIREEMTANEPAVFGRDYWREEDRPASGLKKDIGRATRATSTGDAERDAALDRLRGNLGNRTLIEQAQRASQQMTDGLRRDQTKPIISAKPKGGGGAKEASESFNAVETYINGIERSTEALKAETAALGMAGGERLAAVNVAKLEATARQQGITLTQEQIDKVRALSLATDEYKSAIEDNMEAQNFIRTAGGDVFRGLAADARNGATAIDLITNAVDRLAARLSDRAMDSLANSLFGKSGSGESGLLGGLFGGGSGGVGLGDVLGFFTGSVSPLPKFADGAIFRGPGTGTSDSMLARVSTGEAIIPARVVAQNRPVVEALVRDRLPRFADGYMPDLAALTAGSMAQAESRLNAAPSPRLPADRQTGMSADITIKGGEKTGVESSMGPQGPRMEITLDKMVASMLLGGPDTRAALKKLTGTRMTGG